jgi:hypothetical protein
MFFEFGLGRHPDFQNLPDEHRLARCRIEFGLPSPKITHSQERVLVRARKDNRGRITTRVTSFIRMLLRPGREFHIGRVGVRLGDGLPFLAQAVEMKRDCLSYVLLDLFAGPARRNASGEIRGVSKKAALG